jgi:hypothetical protein
MRRMKLLSQVFYTNWIRCLVMFLFSVLLSLGLILITFLMTETYAVMSKAGESRVRDMVFLTYGDISGDIHQEERMADLIKDINATDGVERCILPMIYELSDNRTEKVLSLYKNIEPYNVNLTYEMTEGQMPPPDAENVIVLSDSYRKEYKIGDQVEYMYMDDQRERNTIVLEVVGFAALDNRMEDISSAYSGLQNAFKKDQYSDGFGITRHLIDEAGKEIQRSGGFSSVMVVIPREGVTPDTVKSNLLSNISFTGNDGVRTGQEIIDSYIRDNRAQLNTVAAASCLMLILTVSTLFSMVFMQLKKQQYEMTVFYMEGASWPFCIALFSTVMIPFILLGGCLGLFLSPYLLGSSFEYRPVYGLVTLSLILVVSLLSILPSAISLYRKSPLECIRKD